MSRNGIDGVEYIKRETESEKRYYVQYFGVKLGWVVNKGVEHKPQWSAVLSMGDTVIGTPLGTHSKRDLAAQTLIDRYFEEGGYTPDTYMIYHDCNDSCHKLGEPYSINPSFGMSEHARSYNGDGICWCGHWHELNEFEEKEEEPGDAEADAFRVNMQSQGSWDYY